jgi:hypothetical protein
MLNGLGGRLSHLSRCLVVALGGAFLLAGCSVSQAPDVAAIMAEAAAAVPAPPDAQTALVVRSTPTEPPETKRDRVPTEPVASVEAIPKKPQSPGTEEIIVTGHRDFGGIWSLTMPNRISLTLPNNVEYGDLRRNICRFVQDGTEISGACLPVLPFSPTFGRFDGRIDGNEVRLRQALGPALIVVNGTIDTMRSLKGGLSVGMLGVGLTPELPVSGQRLEPSEDRSPGPEWEAALRGIIEDVTAGRVAEGKYAKVASLKEWRADAKTLGPLVSVAYLDRVTAPDVAATQLEVFELNYTNGTRICGIDLTAEGEIRALVYR